jgi:hypothetical protein
MRSNKELDLPPYNLEIEKTTKELRKKSEILKKIQTPWQTTRVHLLLLVI